MIRYCRLDVEPAAFRGVWQAQLSRKSTCVFRFSAREVKSSCGTTYNLKLKLVNKPCQWPGGSLRLRVMLTQTERLRSAFSRLASGRKLRGVNPVSKKYKVHRGSLKTSLVNIGPTGPVGWLPVWLTAVSPYGCSVAPSA
jgi:hypothetical protein